MLFLGVTMADNLLADVLKPDEADLDYATKYVFAENAVGGKDAWIADMDAAFNRLNTGKYGKNIKDVINRMSSAIRTNSVQWQLANSPEQMNKFEQGVYAKIKETLRPRFSSDRVDTIGGATHYENIKRYGMPSWAKKGAKATRTIPNGHTYFKGVD